ncbi:hypothetical protein Z043_113845 [Scleropages formosus]|uniref:C-factor-like n=1 Tax=Scleropages formosus TaxID=113540 RepID=A0A0P7WUA8_SCLFO|nr:hypothetical protein Z043_113845 [Scleropages formosus]
MSAAFANCRSVLVTGASRGLGLQLVRSLAAGSASPCAVIAAVRDPAGAKELQSLAEKHSNIHILKLDVVDQDSIDGAAKEVEALLEEEGLACLINNAGINVDANLDTVTAEKMMRNFQTNTVAPLMSEAGILKEMQWLTSVSLQQAFLPLLKRAATRGTGMGIHRAAVINMTSLLGSIELYWGDRRSTFKWYPYRTSKSALNMVTRCLAVDLEADGILCVAVHPGWVRTDMGGPEAPLSPEESISSLLNVIGGLNEKNHGGFLHYTGEPLPW